jgi:ferritin-like metal-binding protein YciE
VRQVENLEQVFGQMGQEVRDETSEAARGLISDAQRSLQEAQTRAIRDTLIADAQAKVEHFEIACYRVLIAGAVQMELGDELVSLLEQNLQQEEHTAQMTERSTPQLVQKSMQAASGLTSSSTDYRGSVGPSPFIFLAFGGSARLQRTPLAVSKVNLPALPG